MDNSKCILAINGGSSSIKFGLYQKNGKELIRILNGKVDGIGSVNGQLQYTDKSNQTDVINLNASNYDSTVNFLSDWLEKQKEHKNIEAIGHRIVYGMYHTEPEIITEKLLQELQKMSIYDPTHMPNEITLIETFRRRYSKLLQVACFDTSFHSTLPRKAYLLPLPRKFDQKGVRRYGFHGISYSYLLEELSIQLGSIIKEKKIIIAHLGNGASLAAVKDGKCIDTSMSFTPCAGLPMGTRSGDLDPGIAWHIIMNEHLTPKQFYHMVNQESGLLGISETSADMRILLNKQHSDIRASEAIEVFCYQTSKWIGAYAAALGGLDILVFSGGIGENIPEIRKSICQNLRFLGIELDERKNSKNAVNISSGSATVDIRVIPTNEEAMIVKMVEDKLKH